MLYLRDYILNIRCGLHSGIPLCCQAWFLGPWRLLCTGKQDSLLYQLYFSRPPGRCLKSDCSAAGEKL